MKQRPSGPEPLSPQHIEIGRFLAARRAEVTPGQVGLPDAGTRRTPGLRREEVALLAGVSVSWYTWIEQGRAENVSGEVLDAIARTLRLPESQRVYLRQLAGIDASYTAREQITDPESFRPFVDNWGSYPAYIADRQWNIVVANVAAEALLGIQDSDNLLWELFTSTDTPARHPRWDTDAQETVARFRGQAVNHLEEPRMKTLLRQLTHESPEFARLWEMREVAEDACGPALLRHPHTGELHFKRTTLDFTDRIALRLTVFHPIAGSGTAEALKNLRLPLTSRDASALEVAA
ncbi:helix-turn-helix transcriptional regulator [Streptomyces hundungensis]|uniref:helix-turn-helix transcriptional regulator n=1 Tax=Streptomyces hundungensis TaxID=1077946 RepID=UPI0033F2A3F9